jgi:hypothetical protein
MDYKKVRNYAEEKKDAQYVLNNSSRGQYLSIKGLENYFSAPKAVENSIKANMSYPLGPNFSGKYGKAGGSREAIAELWRSFGLEYK